MADSPASLRRKIGSATDLQSVVRAMKAQAAASVGQYERSVAALGDYAHTVDLGLGACFRQGQARVDARRVGVDRKPRMIGAVVFGSDQGLVGGFNDIVLDFARKSLAAMSTTVRVWAVGDRVREGFEAMGIPVEGSFDVPIAVEGIGALVAQILDRAARPDEAHDDSDAGPELHLFHNRPSSASGYEPVAQRLLPLDEAWRRALAAKPWPTSLLPEPLTNEAGDTSATLRALIREYLFVSIFRASAESLASENASRLAAMDRADRNIDKLLVALNGSFHRLRQGAIDEELADVTSGFRALGAPPGRRHTSPAPRGG